MDDLQPFGRQVTPRCRPRLLAALVALCLASPSGSLTASGACGNQVRVVIDHAKGTATYTGHGLTLTLDARGVSSVPIRSGETLRVCIRQTNPLLYEYDQASVSEALIDKKALFDYLSGVQGAFTGLLTLARARKVQRGAAQAEAQVDPLASAVDEFVSAVEKVRADIELALRLESLYFDALQASDDGESGMRNRVRDELSAVDRWQSEYDQSADATNLAIQLRNDARTHVESLSVARDALLKQRQRLAESKEPEEQKKTNLKSVDEVLSSAPERAPDLSREVAKLVARLQQIDRWLAGKLSDSPEEDEYALETIAYDWDEVQKVTIAIEKKKDLADKIAYRERKLEKLTFKVVPEWWLQPSVGAGLIWADKLVWKEWGVLETGGQKVASSTGETNKRFQFFPIISLTARPLSGLAPWCRKGASTSCGLLGPGTAVTLDLGWNASTSDPAYLLGASLVLFRQLKLGGGVVWQRRSILGAIAPGEPVPAEGLPLRQTYPPAPYAMISILGWPPFTAGP